MALIPCNECGNEVSDQAKTCPKCGAKVKKPKQPMSRAGKLLLVVAGLGILIAMFNQPDKPVPLSPDQQKAQAAENMGLALAASTANSLRKAMKDPDSFELREVLTYPNGAACFTYRATNSFNATLQSGAVLTARGKILVEERDGAAFTNAWNATCTKPGTVSTDLIKRLMDRIS